MLLVSLPQSVLLCVAAQWRAASLQVSYLSVISGKIEAGLLLLPTMILKFKNKSISFRGQTSDYKWGEEGARSR